MQDYCNENLREIVKKVYEYIELNDEEWFELKDVLRKTLTYINRKNHTSNFN